MIGHGPCMPPHATPVRRASTRRDVPCDMDIADPCTRPVSGPVPFSRPVHSVFSVPSDPISADRRSHPRSVTRVSISHPTLSTKVVHLKLEGPE